MDALSQMLSFLNVEAAQPSRFEAAGDWSLRFSGSRHLKVGAVLAGACWITAEAAGPVFLQAGEGYLLASARPYGTTSDPALEPIDGHRVFDGVYPGTVRYGTTADDPDRTILVGGSVSLDETSAALVVDHLPSIVRIGAESAPARALGPLLELLGEESAQDTLGATNVREQLTKVLFVQALRALMASDNRPAGWLGALTDETIAPALELIHREPARQWTVAELAEKVGMSRSSFALRFKTLVGLPPVDYLARWRMLAAGRALRSTDRTVYSVATEFGYGSESAFSTAFKRVVGHSPAKYRSG
ncbi:helix-turn-helix domain-containing protein [Kribbella sp. DT2]|uniref:helix-turn-helix domain-containing protein n=1 Tax=Kribbella sp. DT2 TaxID=3393427 RepID=UPI003CFBA86C